MDTRVDLPTSERVKIAVRDLNFYYGGFHALKRINLDIPERKVTAFIGPSGCGKSTLLRTFNRMFELYPEQRAEGQILLDNEDILTSKMDAGYQPEQEEAGVGDARPGQQALDVGLGECS